MNDILVLGAGKSTTTLIDYLIGEAQFNDWFIHVADVNPAMAESKTGGNERAASYGINLENEDQLNSLVQSCNLVISMLPPTLHTKVAKACLNFGKHFLNASYITDDIQSLDEDVKRSGLSFICEMGLDPGIDHMSAMEMIHEIRTEGGKINSFRSHCGGLISPESDDNPWHYKISWNPRNIVLAGKDGANYLENNHISHCDYHELFDPGRTVTIPGMGEYAWYPNRDSLPYIQKYGLNEASTFVRTTLRHPDFCRGWKKVVDMKLTNVKKTYDTTSMDIRSFFNLHFTFQGLKSWEADTGNDLVLKQFKYLGLDSAKIINRGHCTAADIFQWIIEMKLGLKEGDKDMIIMLHEIDYAINNLNKKRSSHLVVKGTDSIHTAMAKTVGLPLAFAAQHILNGNIQRKGVYIPVYPEVYKYILKDLRNQGIAFSNQ
jgi:saccharopine dehydrogenase-like NADP-dependent oxidoreductase